MTTTTDELKHINTVINYLAHDESKDYEANDRPAGHIFESVLALQEIVDRAPVNYQPAAGG